MPVVLPFRGLRYSQRAAADLADVLCPPYDVIEPTEQAELRARSAYNAVHLELPSDYEGRPDSRYEHAANLLEAWRASGALSSDGRPAFYLHETQFSSGGRSLARHDVIAAVGLAPWSTGNIRPHEHTMPAAKADRLALLGATHANVSPIWLLHRERLPEVNEAWSRAAQRAPAAAFRFAGENHRLWVEEGDRAGAAVARAFAEGGPLYIADGHHRYETSLAFSEEFGSRLPGASATMAVITWAADPGLLALPTHRLIRALPPESTSKSLESEIASVYFAVESGKPFGTADDILAAVGATGSTGPAYALVWSDSAAQMTVVRARERDSLREALPRSRSAAWRALDLAALHELVLEPLIARADMPRLDNLAYTRNAHEALDSVRRGRCKLAVFTNATPVTSVLDVADAGDRMPEKSTYFLPKTPTGIVIRDLERP